MPSLAGVKAGNAFVVIGAVDDTSKVLGLIGRKLRRWGASLQSIGQDLFFKSAFALTPAVMGLNTYIKFDDVMRRVQAKSEGTKDQMIEIRKLAQDLAKQFGFSAIEVGEMMERLAQRGSSPGKIKTMSGDILAFARAAGTGKASDVPIAGEAIAGSLNAFQMQADDAARVANMFAKAANVSNLELEDFLEISGKVAPIMAQMGFSIEETIAIISILRDINLEAETSAIALRNTLINTADSGSVEGFNKLIAAFGRAPMTMTDAFGNLKPVPDILKELSVALKGLGTAQKTTAINKLVDKRATVPVLQLLASLDRLEEQIKTFSNLKGDEAIKAATLIQEGAGGAWREFLNAVQSVSIAFGDVLEPALIGLSKQLQIILGRISTWISEHPELVRQITAFVVAMLSFSTVLWTSGLAMRALGAAVGMAGLTLRSFTAIQMAVAMAFGVVTKVISSMVTLLTILPGILMTVKAAWAGLMAGFELLMAAGTFIASLLGFWPAIVIGIAFATGAIITAVAAWRFLGEAISGVIHLIKTGFNTVGGVVKLMWDTIAKHSESAFNTLKTGFTTAFDLALSGKFEEAWKIILLSLKVIFYDIKIMGRELFADLKDEGLAWFVGMAMYADNFIKAFISSWIAKIQYVALQLAKLAVGLPTDFKGAFGVGGTVAGAVGLKPELGKEDDALFEDKKQREKLFQEWRAAIADATRPVWQDPEIEKPDSVAGPRPDPFGDIPTNSPLSKEQLKPLDALEKGSVEAAKAFYQASLGVDGDVQKNQLVALNNINQRLANIEKNLQVA